MSMDKHELIQRLQVRIREAKQAAIGKLEDDFNTILKFLGEQDVMASKEALTNGVVKTEIPVAEPVTKVEPDRE